MKDPTVIKSIAIPASLHEKLKQQAEVEGRTETALIRWILIQHFNATVQNDTGRKV